MIKCVILVLLIVAFFVYFNGGNDYPEQIITETGYAIVAEEVENVPEEVYVATEEVKVRAFLAEKYHPGTCFGSNCDFDKDRILYESKEMVPYLKKRFDTVDESYLATILKQFEQIKLTKYEKGFYFVLKDGRGCKSYKYTGRMATDAEIWNPVHVDKSVDLIKC